MGNEEVDIISVAQKPEKKSLLERYNIPVGHLSYEFISQCTDGKTLERIVLILRSGEEGAYPDLTRHAEDRLARIKPTSVVLRKAEPVVRRSMLDADERQEIDDDMSNWMCEMQTREKELDEGKATLISDSYSQPEIRKIKPNVVKDKKASINGKKRGDKPKRISSCDYAAWDKYDVDTEINRIDLQDEQRQAEMKRSQERRKKLDETNKTTHKTTVNKHSLTSAEVNVMAVQEREKGNEVFRAADYEEALRHYNASIEIDSNLNAYNNRAMTFIKLQRYEDALNDCNTVLSMDYRNVKALLRRALSLEHLENTHEALADYESVLKLEPTNKTAISGVNKLRKICESRKIRMKIENINDGEDKAERIKSEGIAKTNSTERQKRRVNSDICYCDRAPSSSRSVATMPHVKTSYCVETESNKAASVADAASNKSKGRTTRDSASDNKLSPVAKDFGSKNKTSKLPDVITSDDIFTISYDTFSRPRDAEGSLKKSIFSCISSPHKAKPSTIIIEELPSDETGEEPKKSYASKNKELISPKKEHKTAFTSNKVQIANKCEKRGKISYSNETSMETKKEITLKKEEDDTSTKKSNVEKNKNIASPGKKNRTKANTTLNKIHTNESRKENEKLEMDLEELKKVESPFEFLRLWQSLKKNANLKLHAKLLRCIAREDMNKIIGNKLDATMFSLILRCLEQQFCTPKDTESLVNLLYSLSRLNRFSIVYMFMDSEDKKGNATITEILKIAKVSDAQLPLSQNQR